MKSKTSFPRGNFNGIFLVGEAFGLEEQLQDKPFVGPAGWLLNQMLGQVGIRREECAVGNLVPAKPSRNDFSTFTEEQVQEGLSLLYQDIEKVKPNVIVPLGAIPLKHLCDKEGIGNWRGSIIGGVRFPNIKHCPTYHPAGLLRAYHNTIITMNDLDKIKKEALFPEFNYPQYESIIRPTFDQIMDYLESLFSVSHFAIDIETMSSQQIISCIGFSHTPSFGMCVPIICESADDSESTFASYLSMDEEKKFWKRLSKLLSNRDVKKVMHNAAFEKFIFAYHHNITINSFEDTIALQHVIHPEWEKSLAFVNSMYTRHPYYKYERKSRKQRITAEEFSTLYLYCIKDNLTTVECYDKMLEELKETGLEWLYRQELEEIELAHDMTLRGMKVDFELREVWQRKLRKREKVIQAMIDGAVGHPLNPNSSPQMKEFLYKECKYKPVTTKGKVTTGEDAILKLHYKSGDPVLPLILLKRGATQAKSFWNFKTDMNDSRAKASWSPVGTETGR